MNDQSDFGGCSHTGTYGNDDTIELFGSEAFEITRSNSTENNDAEWNDIDFINPVTIEGGRGNPYSIWIVPGPGYDGSALDNRVTSGGGLTLRNVTIARFRAPAVKASLSGNPVTSIESSIFRENRTTADFSEGAAVYNYGGVVNISRSSFIRNVAEESDGGAVAAARVDVDNATFVYNSAGKGSNREGGAIYITDASLPGTEVSELDNVTITRNSASGDGGGVYVDQKDLRVRNSILAHNRAGGDGPECALSSGAGLVSSGSAYNLVYDDTDCGLGNLNASLNVVGEPAKLAEVSPTTGRHTPVSLPLHDSPVIDAGSCTDEAGSPVGNDQRTAGRPATGCEIGAVEKIWDVYTVDSEDDTRDADTTDGVCADGNGNCTLRAAIDQANASSHPQEIVLPAGAYTLTRAGTGENANATGDLDVDRSEPVIINGAGADTTIIDANGIDRVIHASGDLWLRDLRVTGGDTSGASARGDGGGILAPDSGDTLNLTRVSVADNRAQGGHGGGIYSAARLRVIESTIRHNAANGTGRNGGGLYLLGDYDRRIGGAWIEDTSIVGNTAAATGGGIHQRDYPGLHLEHVTVTENASQDAQQIRVLSDSGTPRLTAHNSIVAGNGIDCVTAGGSASIDSRGYNLESGSTCGFSAASDRQTTSPDLAALADAGGPLQLSEPNAGSPAVDQGLCTDANGRLLPRTVFGGTRPQNADGPSPGNTGDADYDCDIGAAERQQVRFEPGASNPDARTVSAGSTGVVMAQIELTNESGGAVYGTTLAMRHLGTGDPADVTSVRLYLDENDDGQLDAGDTELASTTFDPNSETVTFDPFLLGGIVPADPINLLIVYDFSDTLALDQSAAPDTTALSMASAGALLLPLAGLLGRRRRLFLALSAALILPGCGGGGGGGDGTNAGTQGATFQVELEKAGTVANSGDDFSLRVKPVRGAMVTVEE